MNYISAEENLGNISIDPEQLKIVVGIIKKCIFDLKSAKRIADDAWNKCKVSLEEEITKDIDEKKEIIRNNFDKTIEGLEKYANNLDSVSNIWKETEIEIMSTSKQVEQLLSGIKNGLFDVFGNNNK